MLLYVDAVLTSIDSVDVNWKNSHVFLRAVLTVLLVLLVLTLQTKRDRFWDNWSFSDDSVAVCCYMLMLCWLVLIVLTWIEKTTMFLWELCWQCCLCWLCWRCRQRDTGFETTEAVVTTVLLHVATCWCCVDWCWQMLIAIGLWKVLIILERIFWRKWRLSIQREPSAEYNQNFLSYRAIAEKWWNPYKSPESSQNTKNGSDINF